MSPLDDLADPTRDEIRQRLLSHIDVRRTAVHYTTEGMLDTSDLWWLYDQHRIMVGGDAWLLAMMWEGVLNDHENELLSDPLFWEWYDQGRI